MPKEEACFIQRLYAAIEEHRSSIVDWDPHGKGFIVGNLNQFTNQVLLRKFGIGRLDSFARKLNRHGFKRSKIDKNKIRFFHKHFNKDSKNLNMIKKLSKYQSLPKHIKLRMIRQQLKNKNRNQISRQADIVSQIFETTKIKQSDRKQETKNGSPKTGHGSNNTNQQEQIINSSQNQNSFQNSQQSLDEQPHEMYEQGGFIRETEPDLTFVHACTRAGRKMMKNCEQMFQFGGKMKENQINEYLQNSSCVHSSNAQQ